MVEITINQNNSIHEWNVTIGKLNFIGKASTTYPVGILLGYDKTDGNLKPMEDAPTKGLPVAGILAENIVTPSGSQTASKRSVVLAGEVRRDMIENANAANGITDLHANPTGNIDFSYFMQLRQVGIIPRDLSTFC